MQLLQIPDAGNLLPGIRIPENKITKTKIIGNDTAQINVHLLGVLVDKAGTILGCIRRIFRFGRLDNQRNKRIILTYLRTQLDTCQTVFLSPFHFRETDVSDYPQYIILILMIDLHRLLIRTCQHYFRTSAHTKRTLVCIQGFGREFLTLLQHELIQIRQNGRIETNAIFHQKNQLHTDLLHIVFQIHLVLYQLNDRHQQVGITQPAEHIFERT